MIPRHSIAEVVQIAKELKPGEALAIKVPEGEHPKKWYSRLKRVIPQNWEDIRMYPVYNRGLVTIKRDPVFKVIEIFELEV